MASSAPIKLKRCRRGGRKKRRHFLTELCTGSEEVRPELPNTECIAGTAAKVVGKRKRKRYRKKNKKASDEVQATISTDAALPKILNSGTEGSENIPQTTAIVKSTSEDCARSLLLKSSVRRKRKRKRKQFEQVNPLSHEGLLVEATSIHQILVGDILTFDRMVLRDHQPSLETTTAKVFLKLKCGDSSNSDYDTLLIRPLLNGESENNKECLFGEPEFLKFADVANVIRKVHS